MSSDEIVKVCKIHGKLTSDECYNKAAWNGKYYLACKKCKIIYVKKYYEKNKEKILINNIKYKKLYGKEYYNKFNRESNKNMTDSYMKHLISANSTLSRKDIPQELIDTWKENLKLKRKLKELKNGNK